MSLWTVRVSNNIIRTRKRICYISSLYKFCSEKVFKRLCNSLFRWHTNILSKWKKKHTNHVRLVLKWFRKYKFFAKLNKCAFDLKEIDYLKFIVEINDIRMNFAKITIITKWVESTTCRHVRAFLKFAKFYWRFIKKFNKVVKSLTNLLKKKKEEFDKKFEFTKKTRIAFE